MKLHRIIGRLDHVTFVRHFRGNTVLEVTKMGAMGTNNRTYPPTHWPVAVLESSFESLSISYPYHVLPEKNLPEVSREANRTGRNLYPESPAGDPGGGPGGVGGYENTYPVICGSQKHNKIRIRITAHQYVLSTIFKN